MQITFTIPDDKVHRVIDAMIWFEPIPLDVNGQPLYTPGDWAKQCMRRWIVNYVFRYERLTAAAEIQTDDELVT